MTAASVVVGLGKTGASCVRHLAKRGGRISVTDSRAAPPGLAELGPLAARIELRLGGFDSSLLEHATQVLMSPGVSLHEPIAQAARARGIEVIGDIELFRARGARTGDRHHRHQRQEHRHQFGGAHGGGGRPAGVGRRQLGRACPGSARTAAARFVRARIVEFSAGHDAVAGIGRGGGVERQCRPSRPLRFGRGLRAGQGADLRNGGDRGDQCR